MNWTERLRCDVPAKWSQDFSQCLFEWQSIIGGVLALLAAFITGILLWSQINQSDRHERQRLKRQHNAVRATLPLTLSGLIEAIREMMSALANAKIEAREHLFSSNFSLPQTPGEHLSELKEVIATTDNPVVVAWIAKIIQEIQTLWSRTIILRDREEQLRRADLQRDIDDWIIQSGQIHALVEGLFAYARTEVDEVPSVATWERAQFPIWHLGIETDAIAERIRRGIVVSENFWSINDR